VHAATVAALRVPTALHGTGLRYKVCYIDPDGHERSKSYPDVSESHKSQVFNLRSAVLSAAVDEKNILTNPCKAKGVKKPVPDKRKITPWTQGRLRTIQLALPPRQAIGSHSGAVLVCGRVKFSACHPMTSTGNR